MVTVPLARGIKTMAKKRALTPPAPHALIICYMYPWRSFALQPKQTLKKKNKKRRKKKRYCSISAINRSFEQNERVQKSHSASNIRSAHIFSRHLSPSLSLSCTLYYERDSYIISIANKSSVHARIVQQKTSRGAVVAFELCELTGAYLSCSSFTPRVIIRNIKAHVPSAWRRCSVAPGSSASVAFTRKRDSASADVRPISTSASLKWFY